MNGETLGRLVEAIGALPPKWHGAGSISNAVLDAICRNIQSAKPRLSVETGTGRTTLLFSHLSDQHLVFTKEDTGDGDSLRAVRSSNLLKESSVKFLIGPTQATLPRHNFLSPIDVAFLDGPHAYPFPDLEYWAIYPHIPAGGLLIVDDIQIPTIANLFMFLKADAMWDLVEVADTTAFFRRTRSEGVDPFGEGWWLQAYNQKLSTSHLSTLGSLAAAVNKASRRLPEPARRSLGRVLGRSKSPFNLGD